MGADIGSCNPNCMAGKTGLTKVEKIYGTVISSDVVNLRDLQFGDKIRGIDQDMAESDECEVVSVTSMGNVSVFGNYTVSSMIVDVYSILPAEF